MSDTSKELKPSIQAVLFDYGGVLAEEGFREGLKNIARWHGLDPEAFHRLGGEVVYDSGYVVGRGDEPDFWNLMCRRSGLPSYESRFTDEILRRFVLRPTMLAAVRSLSRRGYRTAILSDQTDWLERLDARDRFFEEFDQVFNSYRLGKGKRDPSIFDDTLRELNVEPAQALFIDDNAGHVARAAGRGLHTILFHDQQQALVEMAQILGHPVP
jgi:putative hydrolase of the HAD superfamily